MSLSRPDSPPPRQPTPELQPAPLPCPHVARRVASQPKIRINNTLLHARSPKPTRSHDGLHTRHSRTPSVGAQRSSASTYPRAQRIVDDDCQSTSSVPSVTERRRARSTFGSTPSPPPTPTMHNSNSGGSPPTFNAVSLPENASTANHFMPHHRRTLSVAYSGRRSVRSRTSPPASPSLALAGSLPPSPSGSAASLPAPYRYTGPQPIIPTVVQHIICPKPISAPIDIAQLQAQAQPTPRPRLTSTQSAPVPFPQIQVSASPAHESYLSPPASHFSHSASSSVNSSFNMSFKQAAVPAPVTVTVPPLERHKGMGMSCLKFFGLRRSHRVSTTSVM